MSFCCTECWTVYKLGDLTSWSCNNNTCEGSIAYIDDLIQKAVISLNINGIKTMFSCSGHVDTPYEQIHPYVMFSLNNSISFNYEELLEYLNLDDEHVIFDGDDYDYIIRRLSENSNLNVVLQHFNQNNIHTELSYFKPQHLFRVVLREYEYKDSGKELLYLAEDDSFEFNKWVENNIRFTQSILTMPCLELYHG